MKQTTFMHEAGVSICLVFAVFFGFNIILNGVVHTFNIEVKRDTGYWVEHVQRQKEKQ